MPKVLHDVASRALHLHGSLGVTTEMPFAHLVLNSYHMGLADGPTEVHKITVAREVLKDVKPAAGMFPDYIGHASLERARALYGPLLDD
jgi:acyl-CoA dehydrogenase